MTTIRLSSIERDTSIQCRASIDTGVVNEYADAIIEGAKFPPVILFGTKEKCWIGDGWHRVMAADQVCMEDIEADLQKGGRKEALECALGANAAHGHRRTNADKRRCVEIALREFPKASSRRIAELCGVGHTLVDQCRPIQVASDATSPTKSRDSRIDTVTGSDGRQYPAHRERKEDGQVRENSTGNVASSSPATQEGKTEAGRRHVRKHEPVGIEYSERAIGCLEEIPKDDEQKSDGFAMVKEWLNENGG